MDEALELSGGNTSLLANRQLEGAVPWAAAAPPPTKLAHFAKRGAGGAMWTGQAIYDVPGADPDVSTYDSLDPYGEIPDGMGYRVRAGVATTHSLMEPDEYTTTRQPRVSAHFDSSPAARFFQGFANLRWSGMMAGTRPQIQPRPLTQNMNPNQFGSKELHKATQYKPFPPMGSLVGTYGTEKAL